MPRALAVVACLLLLILVLGSAPADEGKDLYRSGSGHAKWLRDQHCRQDAAYLLCAVSMGPHLRRSDS